MYLRKVICRHSYVDGELYFFLEILGDEWRSMREMVGELVGDICVSSSIHSSHPTHQPNYTKHYPK